MIARRSLGDDFRFLKRLKSRLVRGDELGSVGTRVSSSDQNVHVSLVTVVNEDEKVSPKEAKRLLDILSNPSHYFLLHQIKWGYQVRIGASTMLTQLTFCESQLPEEYRQEILKLAHMRQFPYWESRAYL